MLSVAPRQSPPHAWRMTDEPPEQEELSEAQLLGKALESLRTASGLTQAAAAKAAGIGDYQAWQRWEKRPTKGIFEPSRQRQLAKAIGYTRDDLIAEMQRLARHPHRTAAGPARPAETAGGRPYEVGVQEALGSPGEFAEAGAPALQRPVDFGWLFDERTSFLRVLDDRMTGDVEPGMIVAYDSKLAARVGDLAVVEPVEGLPWVTEYRGRTSLHVLGRERLPAADVAWERVKISGVWKVLARFDL